MDILAPLISAAMGNVPPICVGVYLFFRINYQEKEIQRLRKNILEMRNSSKEKFKELSKTVVDEQNSLDNRIKKIEFKIAKIWSNS